MLRGSCNSCRCRVQSVRIHPCVLKSGSLLQQAEHLPDELKTAVARLEDVPYNQKDWRPQNNRKVLDLIHPPLLPLIYGRPRVLMGRRINLSNALNCCGIGRPISRKEDTRMKLPEETWKHVNNYTTAASARFQWLPYDISLHDGRTKIDSYINNLHPVDRASLYTAEYRLPQAECISYR